MSGGRGAASGGTAVADGPAKNRRVGLTGWVDGGLVRGGGIFMYTCSRNTSTVCVDKRLAAVEVFKIIMQIFQNVGQPLELFVNPL